MTSLLVDTVKRLTEAWVSRLALPGLLYVASLGTAIILGWRHALDLRFLAAYLQGWISDTSEGSAARFVLMVAIAFLGGAGIGLASEGLGSLISRLWACEHWRYWPRPIRCILDWRVARRARRWDAANAQYSERLGVIAHQVALAEAGVATEQPYDLADSFYPVLRLGRVRPTHPTWVGDRIRHLTVTLHDQYGLDLTSVWPALSLTMPSQAMEAVDAAQESYQRASTLAAWSVLYVPLGMLWPPAILVAATAAATASRRARTSIERYCLLVEAAVVLHTPSLAQSLSIDAPDGLDRKVGTALTRRLRGESNVA